METTNEKLIGQLNNLVEINNDRIQGYERAKDDTTDNELKSLFNDMASHSRTFKEELAAEVRTLGGEPTEGTRNSGKIFRAWMDIKAALTGKKRKEILSSCESGEDAALEAYDEVLGGEVVLTDKLRDLVSRQKQEISKDHSRIKMMRDMAKVE
ncbi:MAG: ferritin-like domain-containing protein [Bacteroidia bacterium]